MVHYVVNKTRGIIMPTDKMRYTISLEDGLDDEIETYRYNNRARLKTKNKAINELLLLGIQSMREEIAERDVRRKKAPTTEEAAEAIHTILHYQ